MGKGKSKKRTGGGPGKGTYPGGIIGQAVSEIQKRLPGDLGQEVERRVAGGQKRFEENFKEVRKQLSAAATRADIDRLTRRLDQLTRVVEAFVVGGATEAARQMRKNPGEGPQQRPETRPAGAKAAAKPASRRAPRGGTAGGPTAPKVRAPRRRTSAPPPAEGSGESPGGDS